MSAELIEQLDDDDVDAIDALAPPGETVEAVLGDVQAAVRDLTNLEIDVEEPADLDRVRQSLPTEPTRALLVQAALPRALQEAITYVRPSERQDGYWRRTPDLRDPANLSDAQLRFRAAFVETTVGTRGDDGVELTDDGRAIPKGAAAARDELTGQDFTDGSGDEEKGQGILRRILDRL